MIKVRLKGDIIKEFEKGVSPADIAKSIGMGLYKSACAALVDGELADLRTPINQDCELSILTFEDEQGKKAFWHTSSHVLAQAVKRLFPEVKLAIGPSIDNGFYYDFDRDKPFTPEDLEQIEKEMKSIIKEGLSLERFSLEPDEAIAFMQEKGEDYKVELIKEHAGKGERISFYKQAEFVDLCAGPHLLDVSPIKAVKLLNSTGAYWRGDASNKQLYRIYGTAFPKQSELEAYLQAVEEAKKRDHRRLGRELDLFDIYEEGPGFPFFLPKGMILRNLLEDFWRQEHFKNGYQEIKTPIILNEELWHRSGHWDHYKENMYFTKIDENNYAIKPMNCPGGMLAFKRKLYSYRDLPLRLAELGLVHRHEMSGTLHGLMRVRCFTQDDAHIFMTPEHVEDEILSTIALIENFYNVFGFKYKIELSTRPEDSMGTDEQWEIATRSLMNSLDSLGREYKINEGDGAFYGPKIDFHLEDSIGRTWQCGTIQLDFQMPDRFDLSYIDKDGAKSRPVMIHRVVFGSIERFIAILTEHYAGAFPVWLSPVQVRIIPVSERHIEYGEAVLEKLLESGLRAEIDYRNEKIGYKIREAQLEKLPYMLIVGDKEAESGSVAVRSRKEGDIGQSAVEEFIKNILNEVKLKTI